MEDEQETLHSDLITLLLCVCAGCALPTKCAELCRRKQLNEKIVAKLKKNSNNGCAKHKEGLRGSQSTLSSTL